MPYEYVDPDIFMTHNGAVVYHTYKGGPGNEYRLDYWFTTDACEADEDCGGDHVFDVRDLPTPPTLPNKLVGEAARHKAIIAHAIDTGALAFPEGAGPSPEYGANECVVQLPNGHELRTPGHPAPCEYVRIVDASGNERVYWDSAEWQEDPEGVMGAIVGAMKA
jgi:hypothetical protein